MIQSPTLVHTVLSLLSAAKLAQFSALSRTAMMAPDVASRVAMAKRAAVQIDRVVIIGDMLAADGVDQMAAIARYIRQLDAVDHALNPADWWEALVKGYIEQGVAGDLEAALIDGLGEPWIERLAPVRSTGRSRESVERIVATTAASDARWESRLSLWGRRVVGEVLSAVQRLVLDDPDLAALVAPLAGGDAARLHLLLSSRHATRMARLGLTA